MVNPFNDKKTLLQVLGFVGKAANLARQKPFYRQLPTSEYSVRNVFYPATEAEYWELANPLSLSAGFVGRTGLLCD